MTIFHISKSFSKVEIYFLTDQIRRSSRSVSGNLAEAFRKRKYPKSFISKLTDSEGEAAETQVWLDYAMKCGYIDKERHSELFDKYDHIISMLVNMSIKLDILIHKIHTYIMALSRPFALSLHRSTHKN